MPNPIKYNVSTQTLALKKGNFWIGTGDVPKGETGTTDYWNGIKPPVGGYTIYLNKASQGPSIYVAANDAELISLTNKIGGTSYTTVGNCLSWFAEQTDKMAFNRDYESIVTNGLVLNLDADFVSSYPRLNNNWYDLSRRNSISILTNGPTYNSSNSSITLDGVNDYIDCGNGSGLQITGSITVETWVYLTSLTNSNDLNLFSKYSNTGGSTNQGWILFKSTGDYSIYGPGGSGGPANNEFAWLATSNGDFNGALIGTGVQVLANTWYQVVGVFNSSNNSMQIYVNGILRRSAVRTGQTSGVLLNSSRNVFVGATPDDNARYVQGNILSSRVYNIALTATEVSQNFFASVPIVRNGLVFDLVAGDPTSYVSGSINWIDTIGGSSGVLTNGPTFTSSGSSSSLVFDGSNDAIIWSSDPLSSLTSAKTYELWVKFSSTIVNTFTISCGTYEVYLQDKTTWYINQTGAANSYVSWTFNSGWTHFVYSFDGSNHLCYINGVSYTINFGSGVSSQTNLYIGNRVQMDSPMKGDIAITRMYNRGLSATEILQNYNSQKNVFGL